MKTQCRFTRRQFFKVTSTLAASAPLILHSDLWAAAGSPNDRLALGFIGLGKQGRYLLGDFLKRSQVQVVAVCEVDRTRRESAKQLVEDFYAKQTGQTYKGCDAYTDFRELLARKDIDAVVIATPDHWHAFIAIAAAKAGKDIYCEKPLCQSIREARAMVEATRKNKRVFQVGSQQRSSREFRTAVELIRNGRIGKIKTVEVAVGGPAIPCDLPGETDEPGLEWDLWLGPAAVRPYNSILSPRGVHNHYPLWRNYREYGGGGVTDWGAHHFDIVQWALDMDNAGPVTIFPPAQSNAKSGVRYLYAGGVEVTHLEGNGVTFRGTEGKLYVNRGKFQLWIGSDQKADKVEDLDAVIAEYLGGSAKRVYESNDHKADWLDCIRSRKQPVADVEIGARTVTVCHLVNLAYYYGWPMKWDAKRENFAGHTGNAGWLEAPQREKWRTA